MARIACGHLVSRPCEPETCNSRKVASIAEASGIPLGYREQLRGWPLATPLSAWARTQHRAHGIDSSAELVDIKGCGSAFSFVSQGSHPSCLEKLRFTCMP